MLSEIGNHRTVCKLQFRLLPLLFALYVVAFIDRINLGFAALTNCFLKPGLSTSFSIEVAAKGGHHLTYPPHEVRCAYNLERSRGKVGGLKMKGAIPTTAESIYIGRAEERLYTLIVQMQTSKPFHNNVKTSIPIVHEITARAGE
jgi:hypothetical protein